MNSSQQTSPRPEKKHPVILTPPGGKIPPKSNNSVLIVLSVSGLVVLLVLAIAVVWYLPRNQQEISTVEQTGSIVQSENHIPPDSLNPGRSEAERLLGEWLRHQARAEADNIAVWGTDAYSTILASAAEADRLMQQKQFTEAQGKYHQVMRELEQLLAARNDLLVQALDQGTQALEQMESERARKEFAMALAIDPTNKPAQNGFRRAENLERVLDLYHDGKQQEKENNLEQAARLLQEAVTLDSDFMQAAEALASIETRLTTRKYQEAMGLALTALDRHDPAAAEKALTEAARLRPDDQAVADISRRLAVLKKTVQLQTLRQKADKAAAAEKWAAAVEMYTKALAVDPQAAFAGIGKMEAEQRLKLDQSIKAILASPARLQDDAPLREAEQILAAAKSIDSPGPDLSAQIDKLSRLVHNASMTIDVLLKSDNLTTVEIFHVGRFLPFRETQIVLRPGSYTVVGRRPGFRDVRQTLTIKAEQEGSIPVFIIRCEEPI
ncbi:MAG: hypothetical protein ACWGN1_06610 [Desulfobulbales bacterium]